jgi:macrolide transport system ATP-binding/permease protein
VSAAFIELKEVCRYYQSGDSELKALDQVNLRINKGEFVAIMGQSGSGKSTLMNLLGCLDKPTSGEYLVNGFSVSDLSQDQESALRLSTFGFVFQRYQLLGNYTAQENAAMPAIYRAAGYEERMQKAADLLARLGLEGRELNRPSELSGGQQQRVSIARALINGAEVILADEPTGALDSESGQQVLSLLKELHAEGVTIILITHDAEVAAHAQRIIKIKDGRIESDQNSTEAETDVTAIEADNSSHGHSQINPYPNISILESIKTSLTSLKANWFRTFLTLLGIIIGVGSVVLMMAIGEGSKKQVLERIQAMGSDLMIVIPGGPNIRKREDWTSLKVADANLVKEIEGVEIVAPEKNAQTTMRAGNRDYNGKVLATYPEYKAVRTWEMASGVFFTHEDMRELAPVAVIGETVAQMLFPDRDPIGQYVFLKKSQFQIIGLLRSKGASPNGDDMDDVVLVPFSTAKVKLLGGDHLGRITIKVAEGYDKQLVKNQVTAAITARQGRQTFRVRTMDSFSQTLTKTQETLTLLLGSVAAISLIVGGIGVMNIMLVSVSERRREIGLRIATGAKPSDIMRQFNIEALVVGAFGGALGVLFGILVALAVGAFNVAISFSLLPALIAFSSAVVVGLVFGHTPARKAANLDPIRALSEE